MGCGLQKNCSEVVIPSPLKTLSFDPFVNCIVINLFNCFDSVMFSFFYLDFFFRFAFLGGGATEPKQPPPPAYAPRCMSYNHTLVLSLYHYTTHVIGTFLCFLLKLYFEILHSYFKLSSCFIIQTEWNKLVCKIISCSPWWQIAVAKIWKYGNVTMPTRAWLDTVFRWIPFSRDALCC